MGWLSLRLACLVLLGSAASPLGFVRPAFAQIPVFRAAAEAEPEPAVPPAPTPATELPPSPAPPSPVAVTALPSSPNAPPPAKADRITTPDAHDEAEANRDEDEAYDESEEQSARRSRWYGWQTLIADAPSVTAFLAGVSMAGNGNRGGSTLAWAGILGYELAPSIVHFSHGNPGRGFASLGIRFGMPLAGAFIGASLASGCNRSLCEASGIGVGALLGMGGAIAIDAAVLAYDDPRPFQARRRIIVPLASLTRQQAWIGVGGEL